jgi:hypothetical protein
LLGLALLAGTDFFTAARAGDLLRAVFIRLESRRVDIAGITAKRLDGASKCKCAERP